MSTREDQVKQYLDGLLSGSADATNVYLGDLLAGRTPTPVQDPNEGGGVLGFLSNTAQTLTSPLTAPFSQEGRGRLALAGAGGLESAVLKPAQALLQVPGLFFDQPIATDRMADFVERMGLGIVSNAEEAALRSGMTPREIANAHGVGNFIGYIAPVTASIKASSILLGIPLNTKKILTTSNLINEVAAGAIFGALLEPADTFADRTQHLLRESAMFGVGRLMLGGLALPFTAYRNRRQIMAYAEGEITNILDRIKNGVPVEINNADDAIGLARLLSEEEMVASSVQAQELVRNVGDEQALMHAVVGASQSNAGIVRNLGTQFSDVVQMVDKFKLQFPKLKFEIVKAGNETGYSVYFGTQGLNNVQRTQLKKVGRYAGQVVEKTGARYVVTDPVPDKLNKIGVMNSDGSNTRIKVDGITDNPGVQEFIPSNLMMDDLFENFFGAIDNNWENINASVRGDLPESDLIRAIRDNKLPYTDDMRRAMDVSGVITYPEELGLSARSGNLVGPRGEKIPYGSQEELAAIMMQLGQQPGYRVVPNLATVAEVAQNISREGIEENRFLSDGGRVASFEQLFDAWARNAKLPEGATDLPVMRAHFAQKMRERMWSFVPKEEMSLLKRVREEQMKMFDEGELPLAEIANAKGFGVEVLEGGRRELRDLRTGMRLTFGSEQRTKEFIQYMVRQDENMLGDPFNMGSAGIAAIQKGFNQTDGIFNMKGTTPGADRFIERNSPLSGLQNLRDRLVRIEDSIGVPVFTGVFDVHDRATTRWHQDVEPWALRIEKTWEKLTPKQATQVGLAWAEVDGTEMTVQQAINLMKTRGFTPDQINAFTESKTIFDAWFQMSGIDNKRYINLYYSRVQPYVEKNGRFDPKKAFGGTVPPEFVHFAEMTRSGEMAQRELNPAIVMHKYIRSMLFKQHVAPHYENARRLVDPETTIRFRDLAPAQKEALQVAARRTFEDSEMLLAAPLQKTLSEYLNIVRGMPTSHQKSFREWGKDLFDRLGVKVEERVIDEMANIGMSSLYGATMAFRPALVARNTFQTIWTLWPRLGGKWYSKALERSTTVEGAEEAMDAGAIRLTEAGIPFADQTYESLMDAIPVKGTGSFSNALAAVIRGGLRVGDVSRKVARVGLTPYSYSDDMERATAYWWQKLHTADKLDLYESGKLSWQKFLEDGMPHFHPVIKEKFAQMYNSVGREQALRWIGKQGADEAGFIYGAGAQPAWMQSAPGRFLGMFGTWPMWAVELYARRAALGTKAQIATFWARNVALVGIFANMTYQSGFNLWNWVSPASTLTYTGGPVLDLAIQLKRVAEAPLDQKADALRTLAKNTGRVSLPGMVAWNDARDALNMENPAEAGMRMLLGRPDDSGGNWTVDVLYNPATPQETIFMTPEGEAADRSFRGLQYPKIPLMDSIP